MPITLKKDEWKVKDPSSGNYRGAAILSTTLPEDAAQIIEDTESALDAEEVRAGQIINDAQNAVDGIEGQSTIILESIAKAIQDGNNYELIDTAVESWLDAHPEATTTVQDHSLTYEKLVNGTLGFVTPQMFGAKGDGVTDDSQAINDALSFINQNGGGILYCPKGTYIFTKWMRFGVNTAIVGDGIGATIFKFPDNSDLSKCYLYTSSAGVNLYMIGFVGMGGVVTNSVRFENFEMDLNCSNNRHWITHYPNFDGWMNGINLANEPTVSDLGGVPIPPKIAIINNVYIHDAERNCVLTNTNGDVRITNSVFENSDTDHLIYGQIQKGHKLLIDNCIFKGYARESLLQLSGATLTNCRFYDLKNNPTDFTWYVFITCLAREGQETGLEIDNVNAVLDFEYNSEMTQTIFLIAKEKVIANNLAIEYKNVSMQSIGYISDYFVYLDACTKLILNNANIYGAGKRFSLIFGKDSMPNNSLIVSNVLVTKGTSEIYGADGALITTISTTSINGAIFENINIDLCMRVINLNNPEKLSNIQVLNSFFGNASSGYFIDGVSNENIDILFNNVTLETLRANSDRTLYGMKYVNSYYLNNGVRTPIKNTYDYT